MQEKHLFEYAVIRLIPRVEREEFLNVGIVLYCRSQKFLRASFELNQKRIESFYPEFQLPNLTEHLRVFEAICSGDSHAGAIGKLPIQERFRWLTAPRSTILQTSPVHTGLCDDPEVMLEHLMQKLVL